ncbi:hypothetical protein [Streptomyces sp. NPDC001970]
MGPRQRKEAQRLQESLDRRMADQQLVRLLAKDGFTGSRYEAFENKLVRYAISVLRAWMYSSWIFTMAGSCGYGLNPHELDLERLTSDSDLREELATMTVALALPRLRRRAFVEGSWTFEGGAGVTTYFMGACLYDFPNKFRQAPRRRGGAPQGAPAPARRQRDLPQHRSRGDRQRAAARGPSVRPSR